MAKYFYMAIKYLLNNKSHFVPYIMHTTRNWRHVALRTTRKFDEIIMSSILKVAFEKIST